MVFYYPHPFNAVIDNGLGVRFLSRHSEACAEHKSAFYSKAA